MNKKSGTSKAAADNLVKTIRRKTRQTYSSEEKIRIVLAGLRGEETISVLCRREGISESLYYSWSKEFLEAGKRRLSIAWQGMFTSPRRGRYSPPGNLTRGEGAAIRGDGTEGMCRRSDLGKPSAQKKHDRGWGVRGMRYLSTGR
jgi:transposase